MSEKQHGHGDDHGHDHGHGHGHGSPFIQHHYDDAQHQFDSGKLGIWLFLVQEVLFFSALFVAYILYRHHRPEIYEYAHHYLDVKFGAINTAVLIFSSLTAAWAVRAAQLGQKKLLVTCLATTIVCACAFLGIKYIEYSHKIHEGILFGKKFDPCVSSGGGPLITKGNLCEGIKSSVIYDRAATYSVKKQPTGCFPMSVDHEPAKEGIQGKCKVQEVAIASEVKGTRTYGGSREIAACPDGFIGLVHGHAPHGQKAPSFPCYTLAMNPNICPGGPGVLVHYGDKFTRAKVEIQATCEDYTAPVADDVFAEPVAGLTPGQGGVSRTKVKSKHDLSVERSLGPPPPNTNMFFSIYFAMTGLHGIHVLVGILVFLWLLIRAMKGHFTPDYFGPIDYAALYWHIVDLIWIFLFPLLYLIH